MILEASFLPRFPLTSTLSPINADDEEWLRKVHLGTERMLGKQLIQIG